MWGQETLSGHTDKVTAAKFKLTRHQAVTGSRDRTVKEWDLGRAYCEVQPFPLPPYLLAPQAGSRILQPVLWEWLQDSRAFGVKPLKACPSLSPISAFFSAWFLGDFRLWAGKQRIWVLIWGGCYLSGASGLPTTLF